jgi:DNA-binding CsgD family transcriptional regulator
VDDVSLPCHLRQLLRCAYDHQTTHTPELSELLCLSPETINSYWKETKRSLDVRERYQAVAFAKDAGLLNDIPKKRSGGKRNF